MFKILYLDADALLELRISETTRFAEAYELDVPNIGVSCVR